MFYLTSDTKLQETKISRCIHAVLYTLTSLINEYMYMSYNYLITWHRYTKVTNVLASILHLDKVTSV